MAESHSNGSIKKGVWVGEAEISKLGIHARQHFRCGGGGRYRQEMENYQRSTKLGISVQYFHKIK